MTKKSTKTKKPAAYKGGKYPFDAEYVDGTTETIELRRISGEEFFDLFTGDTVGNPAKMMIDLVSPGLMAKLTLKSTIELVALVTEVEGLGEVLVPPTKAG